jgi:nitroreductase
MERLQLIRERQSARVFFDRNRPIPSKEMAQILEAARFAPTAHNMQNFEIVVVDDRRLLETLAAIRTSVSEAFVRENLAGSPSRRRSKTCSASTPSCASLSRAGSATRSYHQITCGSAATSRTWSTITGLVTTSSDTSSPSPRPPERKSGADFS